MDNGGLCLDPEGDYRYLRGEGQITIAANNTLSLSLINIHIDMGHNFSL